MDWTAIVIAIIASGIINTIITRLFSVKDSKKGWKSALRVFMKDRLKFLCKQYIEQGWIYADELEDLIEMHESYHDDVNGNGYLDKLMKQVLNLEVRGIGR